MERILSTVMFITLALTSIAQKKAMTFYEAEKAGLRVTKLDSIYPSGLHSDSTKAVFWYKQDEFIKAYQSTLQDLGKFLKQSGFSWEKPTRCFNRIYFNKDGQIDYFLYNISKNEISIEKAQQFNSLLNNFISRYQFPMKAQTGFAQCSPVRYND